MSNLGGDASEQLETQLEEQCNKNIETKTNSGTDLHTQLGHIGTKRDTNQKKQLQNGERSLGGH